MERQEISLAVYSLLQHSQATTASVETSFSKVWKMSANRNSKVENARYITFISILAPSDSRVGCLNKAWILQILLRICVFSLI